MHVLVVLYGRWDGCGVTGNRSHNSQVTSVDHRVHAVIRELIVWSNDNPGTP